MDQAKKVSLWVVGMKRKCVLIAGNMLHQREQGLIPLKISSTDWGLGTYPANTGQQEHEED